MAEVMQIKHETLTNQSICSCTPFMEVMQAVNIEEWADASGHNITRVWNAAMKDTCTVHLVWCLQSSKLTDAKTLNACKKCQLRLQILEQDKIFRLDIQQILTVGVEMFVL